MSATEEPASPQETPPGFLIHDAEIPAEVFLEADDALTCLDWNERESAPYGARVFLCLGDEQVRDIAPLALERAWITALLPHPDASRAMTALGVRDGDYEALLEHYRKAPVISVDALMCNDELVFSSVVIGRVLTLRPGDINAPQTRWTVARGALKGIRDLHLQDFKLTTGKEREVNLAALGLVGLANTQSSLVLRSFEDSLGNSDGRLALLALAPRSVLGYLWFLLRLLWPGKISLSRLPSSLALVQTDTVSLSSSRGIEYLLDSKPEHADSIDLHLHEKPLNILPGPAIVLRKEEKTASDKETVRLNEVPVDDGAKALAGKRLPLFSHASEGEYRDLFRTLRENANASASFQVLMVLSTLLALAGLYANSAPVIIGAMILAPLMSPIVSLSMGLARTEANLIRTSMQTLGIGVALGLGCAIIFAWIMPLDIPTLEMRSRMSPTLLDLLIAILSGIAGAYANAKEEIAKSLAGVAIAVALVPPLSVAGIGLGWGDWSMAGGAALLLVTNLVGIALAGSLTFLVLGFAPFTRARHGLTVTAIMLAIICIPLYISFRHLVERDDLLSRIPSGYTTLLGQEVHVSNIRVDLSDEALVRLTLSSPYSLEARHIEQLKADIGERVDRDIILEVQTTIRR